MIFWGCRCLLKFCFFLYLPLGIEEGNGNPVQYSCLENPMDREGWQATVHGVARVRHDLATIQPPPCLGMGLLCHWVLLCLVFKRTSTMFSLVEVPIYILTSSVGGFLSLHSLCRICCCEFLMWPFWSVWGGTAFYIWFACFKELVMLSIFSCALWPSLCRL